MKQHSPEKPAELPPLDPADTSPVAEQIYHLLYLAILRTDLLPGTKLSETEIARQTGVSRQPVREAFRRLAQLGFLLIRPQRATVVAPISESRMRHAQFIRCALEIQTARAAAEQITKPGLEELRDLIAAQGKALETGEQGRFFALDDLFHQRICELSGHGYAWPVITDHKVHMDRMRYRSLNINSHEALSDHQLLLQALEQRDPGAAEARMRIHLGRILSVSEQMDDLHDGSMGKRAGTS